MKLRLLKARLAYHAWKANFRRKKWEEYRAAGNRAHYWLDTHMKAGDTGAAAVNDRQIVKYRKLVAKWEALMNAESHEVHRYREAIAKLKPKPPAPVGEGFSTPHARWNPYERPIANWILPELEYAAAHGWTGVVTSGYRSYAKQKELYEIYRHGGNIAAYPGQSNHEGYSFPKGAVDVSNAEQFHRVIQGRTGHRLKWGWLTIRDLPHFSGSGR